MSKFIQFNSDIIEAGEHLETFQIPGWFIEIEHMLN